MPKRTIGSPSTRIENRSDAFALFPPNRAPVRRTKQKIVVESVSPLRICPLMFSFRNETGRFGKNVTLEKMCEYQGKTKVEEFSAHSVGPNSPVMNKALYFNCDSPLLLNGRELRFSWNSSGRELYKN